MLTELVQEVKQKRFIFSIENAIELNSSFVRLGDGTMLELELHRSGSLSHNQLSIIEAYKSGITICPAIPALFSKSSSVKRPALRAAYPIIKPRFLELWTYDL